MAGVTKVKFCDMMENLQKKCGNETAVARRKLNII
jgi:hypothetical protein